MNVKLPNYLDQGVQSGTAYGPGRSQSAKRDNERGSTDDTQAHGSDRVSVSDTARLLRSTSLSLNGQPVVDVARVTSVRQDIIQGTLRVDPDRIAEKMISLERALRG